jgi:hypothetical protein
MDISLERCLIIVATMGIVWGFFGEADCISPGRVEQRSGNTADAHRWFLSSDARRNSLQ